MKFSTIVKLSLIALLLVTLALCAVSCNRGDNNTPDDGTTGGEDTTTPPQDTEAPGVDLTLIEDNQLKYTIVIPDSSMIESLMFLRSTIITLTKTRCDAITYDQIDTATTENFIYVGFYPGEIEGTTGEDNMTFGSWIMEVVNGKDIAISGYSSSGMYGGVDELSNLLKAAYNNGNATVEIKRSTGEYYTGLFSYLPVPKGYSKDFAQKQFSSGVGVTQLRMDDMSAPDALEYLESMKTCGLTEHSSFSVGNTYGGTYYVKDKVVYYVTHHTGALRINAMPYKEAFLPENPTEPNFEKVCDTKGYMIGVSADEGGTQNGMCFVYLLADGTFVVFDGGRSSTDAVHLYDWLEKLAKQNDLDEIVISALQLTHAHGDHFGFLSAFLSRYVSTGKVTLETIWLNRGTTDQGGGDTGKNMMSEEAKIVDSVNLYAKGTKVIPLHTGQSFYMADVFVEVMFTMEDFDQYKCYAAYDTNAASTSVRLTVNDISVLMTGDSYCDNSNMMATMYKDDLKVDILQVPHHGVWREENGTKAFYNVVKPTYALVPCGEGLWKSASSKQAATVHLLSIVMAKGNTIGKNVFIAGHYGGAAVERVTEIDFETGKITAIVNKGQ
ncbi:MAG: MBL fold metallo-hydrolase [Clostridia bacterium]|nr:MBL fold metallo-hydrolase [Clostridia bacterium]